MMQAERQEQHELKADEQGLLAPRQTGPGGFAKVVKFLVQVRRLANRQAKKIPFEWTPSALSLMCSDGKKDQLRQLGHVRGVARELGVNLEQGLQFPSEKATANLEKFGTNVLPEPPQQGILALIWKALEDAMLRLLLVSAAISLILGTIPQTSHQDKEGWVKGVAIFIAVFVVVVIGSGNDWSKERQFRKLNRVKNDRLVEVIRNGQQVQISVLDVIVGDVVVVQTGDKVVADGIFISGADITVDESGATGEPDAIRKDNSGLRKSSPFFISGTQVLSGYGKMLVVAVGVNSFNGKTLMSLRVENEDTPLAEKLTVLAAKIGKFGMAFALLTFFSVLTKVLVVESQEPGGIDSGIASKIVDIVVLCITVVVVAIPEGLPLAVAITLAYSMNRMLKDKNLVKQMDACETMGGATTICSDKTGTLTQNKMTVVRGHIAGHSFDLMEALKAGGQGAGARMVTEFCEKLRPDVLKMLVDGTAVNSTAYPNPKPDGSGKNAFLGNSTECALMEFMSKFGFDLMAQRAALEVKFLMSFSSERKRMSTIVPHEQGYILYCKGASEIVLQRCSSLVEGGDFQAVKPVMMNELTNMAAQALRTIGLAYKLISKEQLAELEALKARDDSKEELDLIETDMVFLGIVGIQDPLREEVPAAVAKCHRAGVRVIMVTGDNIVTAKNIAKNCGIYEEGKGIAMEGPDFRQLDEKGIAKIIHKLQVLARSSPTDKQMLVKAIKDTGEVVAVTGDGTNDAPALKLANVGFAMGISGTEVAREAADVVLMDDNFASIVKAIMWGRNVFDGIRSFLQFQLTVNFVGGILTLIGALSNVHSESPLTAVQLLWINLIMDTFAALALATQIPTEELLDYAPYGKDEPLISPLMWRRIVGQGFYQLGVNFALLYAGHKIWDVEQDGVEHMTIIFNTFVWCQLFNLLNARIVHHKTNIFSNVFANHLFFAVLAFEIVLQVLFVELGGGFTSTTSIAHIEGAWLGCVLIGAGSLPVGLIINLIPFDEPVGNAPRKFGNDEGSIDIVLQDVQV